MGSDILKEGGPHNIRRVDSDNVELRISIPTDADGLTARECPSFDCSPAYFKIKTGTGAKGEQSFAFCPYCGNKNSPSHFHTKAQIAYAKEIITREVTEGLESELKDALGIGPSGARTIDAGLFSIELSLKSGAKPAIRTPFEEVLRRDVTCPNCTLVHSVFGIATWCPDCGVDIFLEHVKKEYEVVKLILADLPNRTERLGPRVAARDVENCLEDVVSIFEAVLRVITRRKLLESKPFEEVDQVMHKSVGNKYQNIAIASDLALKLLNINLFASLEKNQLDFLSLTFEKRHPITHNLGVVDRKYLERVHSGELQGREIRITPDEVVEAIGLCGRVFADIYAKLFSIVPAS